MDYGTIKSHLRRNLGGRDDISAYEQNWINSAYLDLVTTGKFPELGRFAPIPCPALDDKDTVNTAEDDTDFAMPTDALFIVSVRDTTNDQPLKWRDIRWYDKHRSTTNGKPQNYAEYGGRFYIDPPADDIYALERRFRKKVDIPVLTADAHIPVISEVWHEAIELAATYRGARSLRYPDAGTWLKDLSSFIVRHSEQYTEEEENADDGFSIKM